MHLPLWEVPYEELLNDLEAAPVQARISAVADEACARVISVGDVFGRDLIARLPEGVDRFGENGEFHSYIELSTHD
jgi:diphthamide synthase (EF-2-diphthine--ammonia ligase)